MHEQRDVDFRLVLWGLVAVVLLTLGSVLVCWALHPPPHFAFQPPPRPSPSATPVQSQRFRWADPNRQTVYVPFDAACELYLGKENHANPADRHAVPAAPR